jgi:hypothetical protein
MRSGSGWVRRADFEPPWLVWHGVRAGAALVAFAILCRVEHPEWV